MRVLSALIGISLVAIIAGAACDKKPEAPAGKAAPAKTEAIAAQDSKAPPAPGVAAPATADPAQKYLDAAIAARGGLAKLKAATSYVAKGKGTYMGLPYTTVNTYQDGEMRMDITSGSETWPMVMGLKNCWSQMGPVVSPCPDAERRNAKTNLTLGRAAWLWPLKEAGAQITLGKGKVGDAEVDTLWLKIGDVEGQLFLDPKTFLVRQITYKGNQYGQDGEAVEEVLEHKELCGVHFPIKFKSLFAGKPFMDEELTEVECKPVEAAAFAQPEQVKDGTILEKTTSASTVACTVMKGEYSGTEAALGKLFAFLKEKQLGVMGAPIFFYLAAPPFVNNPKQFVTEVCFPVAAPAPRKPQKMGEFFVKAMKPMTVLAAYGVGDYAKKSPELAKLLMDEVKKRKLKVTGAMGQVTYSDPKSVAADALVSEMILPIKGTPKNPAPAVKIPGAKGK